MIEVNNLVKAPISQGWIKVMIKECLNEMAERESKEISIAFVGDRAIKNLNKIYRKKDRITDVLSFEDVNEIIICYSQAKRQAKDKKHSIKKEIEILLIHGLLHLLGYDHQKEKDVLKMEELEKKLTRSVIPRLQPRDPAD